MARRLLVGLVFGLTIAAIVVLVATRDTTANRPATAIGRITCPVEGEPIAVRQREYRANPAGGMPNATAALAIFLAAEAPSLHVEDFTPRPGSPGRFAYRENDRVVAELEVAQMGDGWHFTGLSACNSFLETRLVEVES
jgi:hypothetical protein